MHDEIVQQVAAIIIAGGVIWMARGLAQINEKVGVLTERVEGIRADLDLIRSNYVAKHDHDRDLSELAKRHENLSGTFYHLREEHIACRCCADAKAKIPAV